MVALFLMSFAELKEQVAQLPAQERQELAAFLAGLEEESNQELQAQVDRRMKAMDSGRKITMEQFERLHQERELNK